MVKLIKRKKRKYLKTLWCLVFSLIIFCAFSFVNLNIKPVVLNVALSNAQTECENAINKACLDTLEQENIDFESLIKITYNKDNSVKSVATNTVCLNKIKLKILKRIVNSFKKIEVGSFYIRLGSFLNSEFFYGRGAKIKFNYEMSNTVDCDFRSKFESAGINQTKHKLSLYFTTDVFLVTKLFNYSTKFKTEILLDETVIVGEPPKNYTNIAIDGK